MNYRELPVEVVLSACENWLALRKDRIARERDEIIHNFIKYSQTPRKFAWIFTIESKYYTEEEAIKILDSGDIPYEFHEWHWIETRGQYWLHKIKSLLNLCKVRTNKEGTDKIIVSDEMSRILF